jgi:adenine/guanine phosphoribosyltransferase-like PRPP-binding protein
MKYAVISTGGSYRAMINLVKKIGANIKFAGVVLKEGDFDITDVENKAGVKISFLEKLPVFEV